MLFAFIFFMNKGEFMSQKKHTHTEKVLKGMSKRAARPDHASQEHIAKDSGFSGLRDQYDVIREDIMKLREDLQKGYDMAKGAVDRKNLLGQLFKSR
jgi:hypothetical protein